MDTYKPSLLGVAEFSDFEGWESAVALNGQNLVIGFPINSHFTLPKKGTMLGQTTKRHLLSVAPTRTGKGVSLIVPNLLVYAGSAMVIDPKGENAWLTAEFRRKSLCQKVLILDPWGEVNRRYGEKTGKLETIARFNPLSILDPESEHYADDLAYLADALVINQGKDPHWDDSARELVAGLISYVIEDSDYRPKASLGLVRQMLSRPAADIRLLATEAQKLGPESVAARKLGFYAQTPEISVDHFHPPSYSSQYKPLASFLTLMSSTTQLHRSATHRISCNSSSSCSFKPPAGMVSM